MAYAIIAIIVLILDQGSKFWVHTKLDWYESMDFIPGFIKLYKVPNTGAAFGFLKDASWFPTFIVVASILISAVIVFCMVRKLIRGGLGCVSATFVLAGALGNCIDRLITGVTNGYVTDLLKFEFLQTFPVFNVADVFLVIGGILFAVYFIREEEPSDKRARTKRSAAESDEGTNIVSLPLAQDTEHSGSPDAGRSGVSGRVAMPRTRQASPRNQIARDDNNQRRLEDASKQSGSARTPNTDSNGLLPSQQRQLTPTERQAQQRRQQPPAERQAQQRQQAPPERKPAQPRRRQDINIEAPEYNLDDILAEFSESDD